MQKPTSVLQTRSFAKTAKKLSKRQRIDLECAIQQLINNPYLGSKKVGDLQDLRVFKFHMNRQLTLLGYVYDHINKIITLLAVGPHENFYRNLKN